MIRPIITGSVVAFLAFAAGCSQTDCEAMCDSQSLCSATGTGAAMTDTELAACAKTCEANITDKKNMPNGMVFDAAVAACIGDANGSCDKINACVE